MSKLLVTIADDIWYDELSAIGYYYEAEFERILSDQISYIFPDYICIPFKCRLSSKVYPTPGVKIPDLLIMRTDLSEWWITEVELSGHGIEHIADQIAVFSTPEFSLDTIADYIYKKIKHHHPKLRVLKRDIRKMLKDGERKVLVILDRPLAGLEAELKPYDAQVCVFQLYKDKNGDYSYRLDGQYPKIVHSTSHCRAFKTHTESLEIHNPDILNHITEADEVEVFYHEQSTKWQKGIYSGATYLTFVGKKLYPLAERDGYLMELRADQKLYLNKI